MGLLDIVKAGATALLGKAVKKGIKSTGKAVVKGSKNVAKGTAKGVKKIGMVGQQVAGGVKEVVNIAPHAFNIGKAMSKFGFKEAKDVVKTTIAGAYLRGTKNVKRKQAFDIINKMMAKPEFKQIRDTNQLGKALMGFYNANRARQPAVAEIAKYSWRGLKKLLKKAPSVAVDTAKKVGTGLKDAGKDTMSDYLVGRAVQIGGGTLMGLGTTAGTIAVVDELKGKK